MAVRHLLAAAALGLLAACSSKSEGGRSKIFGAVIEKIRGGDEAEASGGGGAAGQARAQLSRAAIEASGAAMIRARLVEEASRSVLSGAAVNGAYVSYVSRFGQMLVLNGTLITASRGLGADLLSVTPDPADPLLRPVPLADWPASVRRTYRFPGRGPGGEAVTVTCSYTPGQAREIEIVEIVYAGRQVEEVCSDGAGTAFTNTHFTDPETGQVWRSVQWLGPVQGQIDLEILEPYTAE